MRRHLSFVLLSMENGWSVITRLRPRVHRLRVELPAAFLTLEKGAPQKKRNALHKWKCSFLLCFGPALLPDARDFWGGLCRQTRE